MRAPTSETPSTAAGRAELASVSPSITRLAHYDLLYRLGSGGMGNVYLARRRNDSGLQRLYAVKAMHPVLSADPEFANMFLDEAHIASQLHHTNVVGIVDLGRCDGRLFLVMDYVEGPTLAQLLAAARDRPPAVICAIVIDMLHGLHAAHSLTNESGQHLDLVHRDVSPSNILVGADGVARLTDFGIAKARMRRTNTSPGVRKGKLSYSAPEQITSPGNEDTRVDLFAAGIVLWNALTGNRLFDGANEAAVILSVVNSPIPPPSTVGLKPPACLDAICLRALDRNLSGRYSSAAEMADDLRRVSRENDLVAGPEQVAAWVGERFSKELERRRAALRMRAVDEATADTAHMARGTDPKVPGPDYAELSVSWSGIARPVAPRRRWSSLAVRLLAILAGAAAAIGILRFFPRESDDPGKAAAPPNAAAKAPVPQVADLPAAPTPEPELVQPVLEADGPTDTETPAAQPGAPLPRRALVRPAGKRRVQAPPPREEPAAPARQPPSPSPSPSPSPPPESLERNPYLRQGTTGNP